MRRLNLILFSCVVKKEYQRDSRSPVPKNQNVSQVMSANKAKDTKPELVLRRALCQEGIRGYRLNYKGVPGKPDIAFVSKRIAVFVHGCFWHRCPHCNLQLPKHNSSFWQNKFNKNVERDRNKADELRTLGWRVLTIWECELNIKLEDKVNQIRKAIQSRMTK